MEQTCLVCGPDVDCEGHPPKKQRSKFSEPIRVTRGKCPICELITDKTTDGKHRLGGHSQISHALKLGPVWCHVQINRGTPFGQLAVDDNYTVHGVRQSDGGLQINTALGWTDSFTEIWAECSPTPYVANVA